MKEPQFVNAEQLETLEQYGAALLSSMISLRTLESFHIAAFTKGLLEEDEEETGKTMCWELRRLMALYKQQIENIMERCDLDEQKVMDSLKMLIPNTKLKRKKKDGV
jgi:hypothetical protein